MVELIYLDGSFAARGELLGQTVSQIMRDAVGRFNQELSHSKLEPTEVSDYARQFATTLNELGPEWLIEARAAASAAGVPVASYLGLNVSRRNSRKREPNPQWDNGLASAVAGHACSGGKALLQLNRGGWRNHQYALSRGPSPGSLAHVALVSGASLGLQAFVNEKGLAGCWQVGPPTHDRGKGIRATTLMRALAERGIDCRQVLELFQELQKRHGLYTSGDRGLIFLFADANGEILHVECGALRHTFGFQTQGITVIANQYLLPDSDDGAKARDVPRQLRMRSHLLSGRVDALRAHSGSREGDDASAEAVCNDHSVATFTATLGGPHFPGWALFSAGHPRSTQPLVVFPQVGIPRPLMDGTVWEASESLRTRTEGKGALPALGNDFASRLKDCLSPLYAPAAQAPDREGMIQKSYDLFLDFLDEAHLPF